MPLSKRKIDLVLFSFYLLNLLVITYVIDIEQLVIADPSNFQDPIWPPRAALDVIHWYGRNFDPLLMARPLWWKATIWIDVIYFGPFYAFACYALWKDLKWIKTPALVWAGMMLSNVTIILFEEIGGPHAASDISRVLMANAMWFLMPFLAIYRWRRE